MKGKNCPNCGAVYTLEEVKCPYCDTLYFDMSCIDFDSHKPIFIKFKVNDMYITQCAIPRFDSMDVEYNTSDICGSSGLLHRIYNGRTCKTNVTFEAIEYGSERTLYSINI